MTAVYTNVPLNDEEDNDGVYTSSVRIVTTTYSPEEDRQRRRRKRCTIACLLLTTDLFLATYIFQRDASAIESAKIISEATSSTAEESMLTNEEDDQPNDVFKQVRRRADELVLRSKDPCKWNQGFSTIQSTYDEGIHNETDSVRDMICEEDAPSVSEAEGTNTINKNTRNRKERLWRQYRRMRSRCHWESPQKPKFMKAKYFPDNPSYFDGLSFHKTPLESAKCDVVETSCHIEDSEDPSVMWTFAQIGPFYGHGEYDWTSIDRTWKDVGSLVKSGMWKHVKSDGKVASLGKLEREVYILGGLIAPVNVSGSFVPYPPLHIHHAHVYPDNPDRMADRLRRHDMTDERYGDHHHLVIQSHGDSACLPSEGGVACMLHMSPDGVGHRVTHSEQGLYVDFDINDVRISDDAGTRPILRYYVEVALAWTFARKTPAVMLSLGNPTCTCSSGMTPGTYRLYRHAPAAWTYFKGMPSAKFKSGSMRTDHLIVHAHQNILESVWLLTGRDAYDALERVRASLSHILDLGKDSDKWPKQWNRGGVYGYPDIMYDTNLVDLKERIRDAVHKSDNASIVCTGHRNLVCGHRDRHVSLSCSTERLIVSNEDPIVIVAFNLGNGADEDSNRPNGPFCKGDDPVLNQHTIVRGYFVNDDDAAAEGPSSHWHFQPPSVYIYGRNPGHSVFCQKNW